MLNIERVGPAAVPADADQAMVPMRDGVRLAADVYRAASPSPGPAVLIRLPYDKDGAYCFMPLIGRYFAARGYTAVVQDVRGKYRSEGATEFAVHEVDDGYDTVQWVTEQPWCNGDVVMWGDSYYGFTAIAGAIGGHPALRAIAPRVTGSQLSTVLDYGDGTRDVEQTSRKMYFATHYVDAGRYEWEPDWTRRPLRAPFDDFFDRIGKRSANFDAEFSGESRFVPPPVKALVESRPVPALYTIGWFDNCAIWSWHDVRALSRDPGWASHLRLRLEAIDHENYRLRDAPVAPSDDHAADAGALRRMLPGYLDPAIEFFDAVLNGSADEVPRVAYEICHGEWRESETWPPREAPEFEYFLAPEGLAVEPPSEASTLAWTHDPSDPVPSQGANPFAALFDRSDLSAVGDREDVLRFTGPACAEDTDLMGAVTVTLNLDAPAGAHVHARLLDTGPGGAAFLIAKGQLRLDAPRAAAVLDLQHIAYRLRAGHRLALDVMSGDFPEYVPEAPAGADPWTSPPGGPVTRRLTLGGPGPSRLRVGPARG
ncbi:CocE/NonD family hydrolase [Actinomadura montaniterrae]|uniref:CocE/NonD family hydrolase n=1 Tax=Actinomadura montaniterrae TaxID=1803903 RepID=A0A6L3VTM7_9ACTN|nr:CocE/NonD family hydrolase [Actinomadura montaniterrae]KAB2379013.1 CocE/NonD family hydrolase [Actinomadura montaniterrae]